jgi:hypothetical protein
VGQIPTVRWVESTWPTLPREELKKSENLERILKARIIAKAKMKMYSTVA